MSKLITSILCVWIVLLSPLVGGGSDSHLRMRQPLHSFTLFSNRQAGPNCPLQRHGWPQLELYSDYWLTDAPIWAWYGVTVDAEGRVTELDL